MAIKMSREEGGEVRIRYDRGIWTKVRQVQPTLISFIALALEMPLRAFSATVRAAPAFAASTGGKANLALADANPVLVQRNDTALLLSKKGAVDTLAETMTWTIDATHGQTVEGILVVDGYTAVTDSDTIGTTISNIVVNVQTKSGGQWVTRSSDIAVAAQVVLELLSRNLISQTLTFRQQTPPTPLNS
jgi:hypothetical protein